MFIVEKLILLSLSGDAINMEKRLRDIIQFFYILEKVNVIISLPII
jgi:hypothetical protein